MSTAEMILEKARKLPDELQKEALQEWIHGCLGRQNSTRAATGLVFPPNN